MKAYTHTSLTPLSVQPSATPNPATVDSPVTFASGVYGDIPPYTYLWDFGDALPTVNTTDLYGYWPLDETSGNPRLCTLGSGPDLAEVGGAVSHTAGRFGNAVTSTITATSALRATLSPTIAMADGLTIAVWFKWGAFVAPAAATTLFCLNVNGQAFPGLQAGRFYDSNYMFAEFSWAPWASGKVVSLSPTQLGPYDQGVWHLFVLTYDPATGNFTGRIDDGCFASDLVWDYGRDGLPADYLQMTVPPADLATANAAVFNWLRVSEAFNGNYADWGGEIDDLRIWTRVLTVAEIADLWYRSDEETPTLGLLGNGLIHSWALDESPSGTRHDSKGTCDLTEVGNVPAVAGLVGNAADMTSGYLWGPALTEALTQKFTFAITFKAPVTDGSYWGLFYIANAFSIRLIQNRVYAEVVAWTDPHASWGHVSADGLWHTVILWVDRDEDNRIQSSLDGAATVYSALPITGTFNVDPGLGSSVYVGNVGENTGVPTGLVVQRLLWWNRSLTAEERATVLTYQSGEETPTYSYGEAGAQTVTATVTSAHGCVASRSIEVVVS